jgi:C1A family cysteine protease
LTALTASANLQSADYYQAKLTSWSAEFGSCENAQAFADNDDIISTHNAGNSTFTLGHNQFSCLTNEQFVARFLDTTFVPRVPGSTGNAVHYANASEPLASSVDWVAKGAVTKPKNQGQCGGCWAFSTTGAMEGAYQIKHGSLKSFSEQELVACDKTDNGCNGGLMDNAFNWLKKNGGLCTEQSYPYTASAGTRGTCKTSCKKVAGTAPSSHKDVSASDSAMMSALNKGPVSVAIEADKSVFQLYKGGILSNTACGTKLDHGVLAVGYGSGYYKVKNSWGASWGEGGYIRMERGSKAGAKGMCGILSGPPSYPIL